MQLIVLDLEWNQPTSYQSAAYRRVGDRLLFEVIQFGAAKLDEGLEIVDTISIPVNPTHYQTIHPRVRRMTGLTRDVLCDAPPFRRRWRRLWTGAARTAPSSPGAAMM